MDLSVFSLEKRASFHTVFCLPRKCVCVGEKNKCKRKTEWTLKINCWPIFWKITFSASCCCAQIGFKIQSWPDNLSIPSTASEHKIFRKEKNYIFPWRSFYSATDFLCNPREPSVSFPGGPNFTHRLGYTGNSQTNENNSFESKGCSKLATSEWIYYEGSSFPVWVCVINQKKWVLG